MKRVAAYIDIEGFRANYDRDSKTLWSLHELMKGIFTLGEKYQDIGGHRLFAHQFGDGFLLVDDLTENSLTRILSVAIVTMQYTLLNSHKVCKTGVSKGNLADVQGCYPECIRTANSSSGSLRMGEGVLTTTPVMGTALIRAVQVSNRFSGALLIIDKGIVPSSGIHGIILKTINGIQTADWIHSDNDIIRKCKCLLGINNLPSLYFKKQIKKYLKDPQLHRVWIKNTAASLNI